MVAVTGTDSPSLQLSQADIGKTATCVVTAGNAKGIVEAPPSIEVIIEGPPEEGVQSYEPQLTSSLPSRLSM